IEDDDVKALARRENVAQPREKVRLNETDAGLIEIGVAASQGQRFLIEIDPRHFLGAAFGLGIDGESAGVATKVEDAPVFAESGQPLTIVPLVEKKTGFVLAARGDSKTDAIFADNFRCGRFR